VSRPVILALPNGRILDEAAKMQNTSVRSQLPQFWTFGLMLRARI
jgi:hypothetical protein